MVYLNRIYTKTGDAGETSLGNGDRVSKTHPRIVAYGCVDELNSVLGMALALSLPNDIAPQLTHIQNDLFDLGADLCVPETETPTAHPPLRVQEAQVLTLEKWIDSAVDQLQPLSSFILPGGTPAAAALHVARTVCRRAEILVLELSGREPINRQAIMYLNRLSDLLFVLARLANNKGQGDVLWVPGKSRSSAE
jgi:cob(I)alamin adenosyltransferase